MRHLLIALVAVTALTACTKESAEPSQPEVSADQSGSGDEQAAAQEEAPSEEPAAEEEEQPVKVTPALVEKYVAFQKLSLKAHEEELTKFAAVSKNAKKDSTVDAMKLLSASAQLTETLEKRDTAARAKVGISQAEFEAVSQLVGETVLIHQLAVKNQAEMQKAIADMKQSLAAVKDATEEQRAEAQTMISQMEEGMKNQLELRDARAEHGDEAVEAILAREAEISELQAKAAGLLSILK